jgi:hypothetical protein
VSIRIRATLIKTMTDDGVVELQDHIQAGKVYTVELRSIRVQPWGKSDGSSEPINRFSIFVFDCPECLTGSWMPLELLKLEAD